MKKILLLIPILILSFLSYTQEISKNLHEDVEVISSDLFEGRATGSTGEAMAAAYIAGRFAEIGIPPAPDHRLYYQQFYKVQRQNPHDRNSTVVDTVPVTNVLAYDNNNAEKTVIIGAHYDHLGHGGSGSLFAGADSIHNGADDNASGVAIMLDLAEKLKNYENYNFLYIAFSGEEHGLWGSAFYTEDPVLPLENSSFMINLDMVGRLNPEKELVINGTGTAIEWDKLLSASSNNELKLIKKESGMGPSDHTSFYLEDIPVLHFFTGGHEDYHKPSDDAHLVNYEGMALISDFIYNLILNAKGKSLTFQKTKSDTKTTPKFTVGLGVMPDYIYDGAGLRIDGLKDGETADNAGIKEGDVVIKMGGKEIGDIYDYMECLSTYKKGDSTTVVINRNGELLEREVTF